MEIYYTFREFKDNYDKVLEEWLNKYPDAIESEYLEKAKRKYEKTVKEVYIE